jgi:hypothetical protein
MKYGYPSLIAPEIYGKSYLAAPVRATGINQYKPHATQINAQLEPHRVTTHSINRNAIPLQGLQVQLKISTVAVEVLEN